MNFKVLCSFGMERQKGKWNGKQVLPAAWVEEASTIKYNVPHFQGRI